MAAQAGATLADLWGGSATPHRRRRCATSTRAPSGTGRWPRAWPSWRRRVVSPEPSRTAPERRPGSAWGGVLVCRPARLRSGHRAVRPGLSPLDRLRRRRPAPAASMGLGGLGHARPARPPRRPPAVCGVGHPVAARCSASASSGGRLEDAEHVAPQRASTGPRLGRAWRGNTTQTATRADPASRHWLTVWPCVRTTGPESRAPCPAPVHNGVTHVTRQEQ